MVYKAEIGWEYGCDHMVVEEKLTKEFNTEPEADAYIMKMIKKGTYNSARITPIKKK